MNQGFVSVNRISSFLQELTNGEIKITNSYATNLMLTYAKKLTIINQELQHDVKNTRVLHFDETNLKFKDKQVAVQGYANENTTYLIPALKKCGEQIDTFLNDYHNSLVVDYCRGYQKLGKHCQIVGCNAHVDRYLNALINDFKIDEAKQMKNLLHQLLHDHKNIDFDKVKKKYLNICQSFLNRYENFDHNNKFYYKDGYLLFKRLKEK
jgi:hypothetical protein